MDELIDLISIKYNTRNNISVSVDQKTTIIIAQIRNGLIITKMIIKKEQICQHKVA
jgi:hypothetical protein